MPYQGQSENKDIPRFWSADYGVFRQEMSVCVGRAAGNTSYGEAGRGCREPGLAKLNYSVLVARGQAIFYVQSQDCSGVSVIG
jgi:hypothetical protein